MITKPHTDESPVDYADRLGAKYSAFKDRFHKKSNGQFFTPVSISRFMANFAHSKSGKISILDPGCGTGVLSCALIEKLIQHPKKPNHIKLTLYETDLAVIPFLKQSIEYLGLFLNKGGICFDYSIKTDDFITTNAEVLKNDSDPTLFEFQLPDKYDYVIANPPYFKLSKNDIKSKTCHCILSGQTNIYALFMAISSKLLKERAQLIFIIPRSFSSGSYFKTFRKYLFSVLDIENIHLFSSRKDTFKQDKVLQETLILSAKPSLKNDKKEYICISSSKGISDLTECKNRNINYKDVIDIDSNSSILYLPINEYEENLLMLFQTWGNRLKNYDIQISTGPVVAFRAKKYIKDIYENSTIYLTPLIWLHNILPTEVKWPINKKGKGQYIQICEESMPLLLPNRNYVLLRRFSSKDDHSRLIAAPYFRKAHQEKWVGIENKVNYIYKPNDNIENNLALGLSVLLNSKLFNDYFRIFNGNVNVSSSEIREMPFPSMELIVEIGKEFTKSHVNKLSIDQTLNRFFELSSIGKL